MQMSIHDPGNLICPIDGDRLQVQARRLVCANGHAFDIARQGYVNLLPVQHKRSRHPGDSKAMVLARAQFLNAGCYRPIASRLAELVATQLAEMGVDKGGCVLDAGCGEGYYLDALLGALAAPAGVPGPAWIGVDISKEAVIQAARRNHGICWVVGSNRRLPVAPGSVDLILCLFGFFSAAGFGRALRPGGRLIMVDPAAGHLQELRQILYASVTRSGSADPDTAALPGFPLRAAESLTYTATVSGRDQVNNLLTMTPHLYRASHAGKAAAQRLTALDITVDVVFRVLERAETSSGEATESGTLWPDSGAPRPSGER